MAKGNKTSITTKRRQQLTRQLVLEMMDKKSASGNVTHGLMSKMMIKLDNSTNEETRELILDLIKWNLVQIRTHFYQEAIELMNK